MKTTMGQYLCEFSPSNPRATKEGYVYTHVLMAEKKLGRYLKQEECVHHIDEDKHNNDIDNLMIFKTVADHTAFHHGVEAVLDGDVWWCPEKGAVRVCPICFGPKDNKAPTCRKCMDKRKKQERINNLVSNFNININDIDIINALPSRDVLKQQVRNNTFDEVGRMYGVTGNTIKRWCDIYNIPRLSHIIKLIPDDEWETESWSEETEMKIDNYDANVAVDEIIEAYCCCPNLRKVSELFHKDMDTIKTILIDNNVRVLKNGESGNIRIVDMYNENGERINSFLTLMDAAKWILNNGYGGNNHKAKKVSYLISKHLDTGKVKFGFIWKGNDVIINYKDYLIA